MAHVTRCPFCNSIWLLPNRQMAEDGPLKCSNCNHSFDATRDVLELPDELFPDLIPDENDSRPMRVTQISIDAPAPAAAPIPEKPKVQMSNLNQLFDGFAELGKKSDTNPAPTSAPLTPTPVPASAPTPKQTFTAPQPVARKVGNPASAIEGIVPSVDKKENLSFYSVPKKKSGGWGIYAALGILLIWLLGALAVAFNQKVIEKFPETAGVFSQVCSKISCPGYYFKNIQAFVVSQTKLIPMAEPGSYNLETVIINNSENAQTIPHLSLSLLDGDGKSLMDKNLAPHEFVTGNTVVGLSAGRALNVKIKLQTNVTPSRCVVKPYYP